MRTVKRNNEGRFIITLSIRHNGLQQLSESQHAALTRFNNFQRRFKHNERLKEDYSQFIREYSELNHMKLVHENDTENEIIVFYLPHHPIFKETNATITS